MSDNDPWAAPGNRREPQAGRDPAPSGPPPPQYGPPQYGPPPQYGYAPYGPPGYHQPLPQRGSNKTLFWILGTVGVLVLGGCGVGIFYAARTVTENADVVNAYLKDVKAQRYAAAYDRICPSSRTSESAYTAQQRRMVADGRALTSYDITSSSTDNTNGFTTRTAAGDLSFADGRRFYAAFSLRREDGRLCITTGYDLRG